MWGLVACQASESHNYQAAAARAASEQQERQGNQLSCHDCDGVEGAVQKSVLAAAGAAEAACGGRVKLEQGKSGLSASDYRCLR
jgi:hypothetical protein